MYDFFHQVVLATQKTSSNSTFQRGESVLWSQETRPVKTTEGPSPQPELRFNEA